MGKNFKNSSIKNEQKSFVKARAVKNPNKYIWIFVDSKSLIITDKDIKHKTYSKAKGISYYYKEAVEQDDEIVCWRFNRNKDWTEQKARIFTLGRSKYIKSLKRAIRLINEYDGKDIIDKATRESMYNPIANKLINLGEKVPKLERQFVYIRKNQMKDKMKKLVELSNITFREFIDDSQEKRPNIIKSEYKEKVEKKGFRFFSGKVTGYKVITKDKDGKEQEHWKIKSIFTSNKADSTFDITSKKAIKGAVKELKEKKVIPIRFEHGSKDYGVWDEFKTFEKGGVLYGVAEGELYQDYSRSKDLWHDIYELDKEFATSYGGNWIEFHWYQDDDNGVIRVLDEITINEISLTQRPANPDTTMEVLSKYAEQLEDSVDFSKTNKNNLKNIAMKLKKAKKTIGETLSKDGVEPQDQETSTEEEDVEPKEEEKPQNEEIVEGDEEDTVDEKEEEEEEENEENTEEEDKSIKTEELLSVVKNLTEKIDDLSETVEKLKMSPEKRKSVAKMKNDEIENKEDGEKASTISKEFASSHPYLTGLMKARNPEIEVEIEK